MNTVTATELKRSLSRLLDTVAWAPVAVQRHGRIVAYLVPAQEAPKRARRPRGRPVKWMRADEERLLELCASRDLRPTRWARAGDPDFLGGVATMLASLPEFDRPRMLALAERLSPGMSGVERFGEWLETTPVDPARFVPMLRQRLGPDARRPA